MRDRAGDAKRRLRAALVRVFEIGFAPYQRLQDARLHRLERQVEALRTDMTRILDRVVEFEVRSRRDIVYAADQEAAAESHRFAREHMPGVPQFRHPWETLQYGISLAPTGGMALEFGVATGVTLGIIAEKRGDGRVYGFDSFDGLPEPWLPGLPGGTFAQQRIPDVPGTELVVGLFDDTLPGFLDAHPGPVDFVHIDSDLYSSARTVLDLVGPRLRPGGVIVFDEFFNYPGWQRHEYRAWREYVDRTGIRFDYEAYSYEDCQVVVRIGD